MASLRSLPFDFDAPRSVQPGPRRGAWLVAGCAALASACGAGGQTGDEHNDEDGLLEELRGNAQRLSVSGSLPNSASEDGWAFAWKLYEAEADPAKNTFFSPYSISVASSMLVAGAAGQTKTEMQTALELSNDGDAFHAARNTVAQALDSRNREGNAERNAQVLRVVNDLWLAPLFRPKQSFLDTLSAYYGASSYIAPFDTDPEAARLAINDKIAEDTEQLILDLLPDGSIRPDVAFVLTNAIYFKARWQNQFAVATTVSEPFESQSGESVPVDMMHAEFNTSLALTDDYVAVALPYDQNELELVAIMPSAGSFESFVSGLSAEAALAIAGELAPGRVQLGFPKLSIEASVPLKSRLQELGMQQAWSEGAADFSGLSDGPLSLSDAFHKATIAIDEEGTVAAAATAFVGVAVSQPPPGTPVTFDRPFVFFVRDVQTNALLFLGHYSSP
jgi:serpin B